jgi:hypothetical protein
LYLLLAVLSAANRNQQGAAHLLEQAVHPPYNLGELRPADLLKLSKLA